MAPTSKLTDRESDSQPEQPVPQRPNNFFKRLSSGLSSILPTVTWRKGKAKKHRIRPTTAPVPGWGFTYGTTRDNPRLPVSQQTQAPQVDIPQLSEPRYCSYNPNTYHSFPSIEQKQCDFCGLCPPSSASGTPAADEPCIHCQTGSPFSHLATPHSQMRSASATPNTLVQLIANSPASEAGPRLVPPSTALTRYANPPRTSSLPHNLTPSYSRLHPSASSSRPRSPRLHHLSLLPGAQAYPYVHRHEVDAHLAAIRAGAPSPLRHSIDEGQRAEATSGGYQDFSQTVFYGTTTTSARVWRAESGEVRREVRTSGMVRLRERWERRDDDGGSEAPVVNGMRLELRGGSEVPRLRGGGSPYMHAGAASQTADQPVLGLRGGAGSRARVPASLYWLAGGTGRPVTIGSWNKEKGRKRQGGLLGRVMYGARSGREYERGVGDEGSMCGGSRSGRATVGSGSVRNVSVKEPEPVVVAEEAAPPGMPTEGVRGAEVHAAEVVEEAVQEHVATGENAGEAAGS